MENHQRNWTNKRADKKGKTNSPQALATDKIGKVIRPELTSLDSSYQLQPHWLSISRDS